MIYDLSGPQIGGAAKTLQVEIVSKNGAHLTGGGGNGISVDGGHRKLGWDQGEDLTFTVSLRDANNADVTSKYSVDLTGVRMRFSSNAGSATFNGETLEAKGINGLKAFDFQNRPINGTTVKASREGVGEAQIAAFTLNISPAKTARDTP